MDDSSKQVEAVVVRRYEHAASDLLVKLIEFLRDVLNGQRGVLSGAFSSSLTGRLRPGTFSCWWPQATKMSVTTCVCMERGPTPEGL